MEMKILNGYESVSQYEGESYIYICIYIYIYIHMAYHVFWQNFFITIDCFRENVLRSLKMACSLSAKFSDCQTFMAQKY
jgi:hypothetical protein